MSAIPNPPREHNKDVNKPRARWRRVVGWSLGVLVLVVLLIASTVFVLLHNSRFHNFVLRTAIAKTSASLGTQVHVGDFGLHWYGISPTVDLYNVAVQGSATSGAQLLQVDHIQAVVQVTSLLRRSWYIQEIVVNHPLARIVVDKDGNNNLPKPQGTGSSSNTDIFDLGIRHVQVNNGEVYYNDQKSILNADLRDFAFGSAFNTTQQSYSGSLGYRNGHLKFATYNPLPHSLQTDFSATRQALTLKHALLTIGESQVLLDATLSDYSNPKIDARYEATIDAGQLRSVLKNASLPSGVIHTKGAAQYLSQPSRSPLEIATLQGEMSSPSLSVRTADANAVARNVSARYSMANGNAEVRDIRAVAFGGEVTGALTVRNITGATRSHLQANARGLSLADLRAATRSQQLQQVATQGSIDATADATWGKNLKDLVVRSDATLQGQVSRSNGNGLAVPVNAVLHAAYEGSSGQLTLTQSYVRTQQTTLDMNGTISKRSSLAIHFQSRDLREIEAVSNIFRTPVPGKPVQPLGLWGAANFAGTVSGSTSAPHIVGQLVANNLRLKGSSWRLIRTNIDVNPDQARLSNGVLQPSDRGKINFTVTAGLDNWNFTEKSPVSATLNGSDINISELTHAAGLQYSIQGTLDANVTLHGSQLNPVGKGSVKLTKAKISDQPVTSVDLNFQGTGDKVLAKLNVRLPAGSANADLTLFPKQETYEGQLRADGIRLEQLQAVKERNMQITGVLNLDANGRGTFSNPAFQVKAQIPEFVVRDQKVSNLNLLANVANHVANINLNSSVMNTVIHGQGSVNLTGDYYANATLDTQTIPLGPLVDVYVPAQAGNVEGQTELHATLKGPLKDKNALEAHIVVPTMTVNYKNQIQLSAVNPVHLDLAKGVLQLQRAEIRGTGTDLQMQGTVPITTNAPASLLLLGTVDMKLAQLYDPTITSSGQLRFNINSYGQTNDPNVRGRIDVVNANFTMQDVPLGLQNGNGTLTLTKDRLEITQFRGVAGSGTVEASGGIVYRPSVQFDVGIRGNNIRTLLPQGIRAAADTQLNLTGNLQSALLSGQVRVDQLSFTPNFDVMQFAGQLASESVAPPSQGFSQALQLNIGMQSATNVNLVSRTLSLQGTANLTLRGSAAQPVILGRINLTGGDVIFSANRYVLQSGTIEFANPTRTDPVVNLNLTTTIDQYNIAMQFWGPIDRLRTTYTSDPALPPSDIINLIAFGKTSEATAANPNPPGVFGAESLLASQVSSQLTSRVEKIAGISQLSIDPVLGGSGQSPGARIAVQQRVTSKLFVTFATDVTSTQRETISLQYQATPRVSFSGTRDQNGGFGFDARFRKTW